MPQENAPQCLAFRPTWPRRRSARPVEEVDLDHGQRLLLDGAEQPQGKLARHAGELVLARL
eukprot:8257901-Alexandrium_andersonii.AAC.1